ncbi:MAG: type II toxin-antitoxin system antitoxin SocA domain-containing protein [Candidatus Peregrinibacteria bacterium]
MIKNFIIKIRKMNGFSQDDLAKKMDMSRPTLAAIENGTRDITLPELKQLAKIFDIPVNIMIDEDLKMDEKIDESNARQKSFRKFHDLVLKCIKYGADEDGKITKTKLAKLVYLCDFANYYKYLSPISGFEYRRLAQGPVAIEFFDLIDSDESVCIETKGRSILVSLIEDPNDSALNKDEEETVKTVCAKWKTARTKEIVDFTHEQLPWATCKEGEIIPYELINMEDPQNVY